MADVSAELVYEVLKSLQADVSLLKNGQRDIREELIGIRLHQHAAQGELNSILSRLSSIEGRIERIERRLDLVAQPAE